MGGWVTRNPTLIYIELMNMTITILQNRTAFVVCNTFMTPENISEYVACIVIVPVAFSVKYRLRPLSTHIFVSWNICVGHFACGNVSGTAGGERLAVEAICCVHIPSHAS